MANTDIGIGSAILNAGIRAFGPFNIQPNIKQFSLILDSTQHLNPAVTVAANFFVSYDGGLTWEPTGSFYRTGGTFLNDGVIETSFRWIQTFDPNRTANRKMRFDFIIDGGSFTTAGGTLTLSS